MSIGQNPVLVPDVRLVERLLVFREVHKARVAEEAVITEYKRSFLLHRSCLFAQTVEICGQRSVDVHGPSVFGKVSRRQLSSSSFHIGHGTGSPAGPWRVRVVHPRIGALFCEKLFPVLVRDGVEPRTTSLRQAH